MKDGEDGREEREEGGWGVGREGKEGNSCCILNSEALDAQSLSIRFDSDFQKKMRIWIQEWIGLVGCRDKTGM